MGWLRLWRLCPSVWHSCSLRCLLRTLSEHLQDVHKFAGCSSSFLLHDSLFYICLKSRSVQSSVRLLNKKITLFVHQPPKTKTYFIMISNRLQLTFIFIINKFFLFRISENVKDFHRAQKDIITYLYLCFFIFRSYLTKKSRKFLCLSHWNYSVYHRDVRRLYLNDSYT